MTGSLQCISNDKYNQQSNSLSMKALIEIANFFETTVIFCIYNFIL